MKPSLISKSLKLGSLILFVIAVLTIANCNKETTTKEKNTLQEEFVTGKPPSSSTNCTIQSIGQLLYVAVDLVASDQNIKGIYENYIVLPEYDDYLYLDVLDSLCSLSHIDLRALLTSHLISKGYSSNDVPTLLDCLYSGFYLNSQVIKFYLRLVNSDLTNRNNTPIKTWDINIPQESAWSGVYLSNGQSVSLNKSKTLSNPVLHIDYTVDGNERWAPFRRCYCSRETIIINEEGEPEISSMGTCVRHRKDDDRCNQVCDRGDFFGTCDGDQCPGC